MALYAPFCFFLVAVGSFVCGQTTAVRIKITPEDFDKVKTDAVEISCLQNNQDTTIKDILVLEIVKDGKPIVAMKQNSKISFIGAINDTRLKAVGQVSKDVSQSYLNLTLMSPHSEDSGHYTCVVDYMDEVGIIKSERDSKNLREQKLDDQSVVDSLAYLKQKIQSNEKSCKDLYEKVAAMDEKIQKQIQLLTNKVDYATAFSVTNKAVIRTQTGKVLILPDVVLMVGNDYDINKGIFTAPRDGLYVFHLVIGDWTSSCHANMEIHAGSRVVASLNSYDLGVGDQTSISPVVSLTAGTKVFTKMLGGGCTLLNEMHTLFSGYLIRAT